MQIGKKAFCDFQTIQEAITYVEAEMSNEEPIVLSILEGIYNEQVTIRRSNIKLIGIGNVVISNGAYAKQKDQRGDEIGTFATATLYLDGSNVHLENITIENTAGHGEDVGQAIALYANCDLSSFTNCRFKGSQDTLFTSCLPDKQKDGTDFLVNRPIHEQYRQYYLNCTIEGTVDYIFGGATAYFENCTLINKTRKNGHPGYITAANTPKGKPYGFIFHECDIVSEPDATASYLGRPWRPYAKVRFQYCKMTDNIQINRWNDWNNKANQYTAEFIEIHTEQTNFSKDYSNVWGAAGRESNLEILKPVDVFTEKFYEKKE